MREQAWAPVRQLLQQAVDDGVVPGLAMCVRVGGLQVFDVALGKAELRPVARPVRRDTAWDLASLTKVLVTTPLALRYAGTGRIDLDSPLFDLLGEGPRGVTARHCLMHSSGLAPWAPLYEPVVARDLVWGSRSTRQLVFDAAARGAIQSRPGEAHAYSDLGFLLLGAALEAVGGDRLDRLWERDVRPLMGVDLRWGWPGAAATEDCPVRGRVVVGEVHDLNAAVLGGIAPHAGLFGSARELARAGAWHLAVHGGQRVRGLSPATLAEAWTAEGPGSHHLGWDGVSPTGSSASERWPLDGVGHLGFTGCSLWLAPRQGVVVALCSNRVHPQVEGGSLPGQPPGPRTLAFRALRPAVHRAVVEVLEAESRWRD